MGLLDVLKSVAKDADEEVDVQENSVDVKGQGYQFRYGKNDAALSRAILDSRAAADEKKGRDKDK